MQNSLFKIQIEQITEMQIREENENKMNSLTRIRFKMKIREEKRKEQNEK